MLHTPMINMEGLKENVYIGSSKRNMKILDFTWKNKGINLKSIFLSHLHPDHIAGVRELPKEIPYIVGKGEIEQYQPKIYGDFLKDIHTLYEIDFSTLNKILPLGPSADIFGDGSFWAISTPGHTKGHISYLMA